ncbi:exosome non-catalytic core subunit rrp40 [Recurvomyces mirabilis]|uniref:Exosome non-catalytic core subunit rrp40 n=1 Tax=Recurvomyces mirabilis TaxID=574656 RepID=A0AAE0WM40_9PEZI|nr:exosome non-catalytic core subunit rrp40 [Recurvomyces mirabilis]KAK5154089.1 exosome non-catalytic core subunit rrp40 [Recurvomyces mirabilis]
MTTPGVLLPGEVVPQSALPATKKGTLTLGPGLHHVPPSTISATTTGSLQTDNKKGAIWLETSHGRYQPTVGDHVIAQIHHSSTESYSCILTPHTPYAILGQLAFEGANKKTRPQLKSGDLVYARVSKTKIECFNSATGKSEGMGPLKAGMTFSVTPSFARRLMMGTSKDGQAKGGVVVLEEAGEKVRFEVAVGRNGKVWIDSSTARETIVIGGLLVRADEEGWGVEMQRKMVKKVLRDV